VIAGALVPSGYGWIWVGNSVRKEIGTWGEVIDDDGRAFGSLIKSGDPVFWWQTGTYGGICGHGQVLSDPVARPRNAKGYLVEVRVGSRYPETPVPRKGLERYKSLHELLKRLSSQGLNFRRVHPDQLRHLQRLVRDRSALRTSSLAGALEGVAVEVRSARRSRDPQLRDEALRQAGGNCETCGRNYSKLLDGLGVRVLQVHHKQQLSLSDAPRWTALKDLAVVCANCHLLIHADPQKAIPVATLKRRLRRKDRVAGGARG
jgi:hypothetical protein